MYEKRRIGEFGRLVAVRRQLLTALPADSGLLSWSVFVGTADGLV